MAEIDTDVREVTPQVEVAPASTRGWLTRLRTRRDEISRPIEVEPTALPEPRRWMSGYLLSFLAMVVAPAALVSIYFAFIASDQYVVETRFAVHSLGASALSAKADRSATTSSFIGAVTVSNDDSYLVAAYIRSRACVDDVSRQLNLREIFRRPEADVWARMEANPSPEALVKYWDRMVSAYVDPPSGIVTVSVTTFRREDGLAVAQEVLKSAERIANSLSAKARADVMTLAQQEVSSAENKVVASLADLRAFREKAGFVDPKMQAESVGRLLESLIGERIRLQTEYEVSARAMSPSAPTLQTVKSRLDQLDLQIADERAKLTSGKGGKALANLLPAYEELTIRNTFAGKLYALAADGLERARLRADAQTIYVDVFVPPARPEEATFPKRFESSLLITLALLIVWGVVALTGAIVEDHKI